MTIVVAAGLLPAIILLIYVYKMDRVEKEPVGLILKLVIFGAICTVPAGILERIFMPAAEQLLPQPEYALESSLVSNFIIVAIAEEGCKHFALRRSTWNNREFNCLYDGVVYAAAVSLGFAGLENLMYIFGFGLSVAPVRALTAIPLHAITGIFMGHYYGMARYYARYGRTGRSRAYKFLSMLIPVFIHGLYDFLADVQGEGPGKWCFLLFVVILDIIALLSVRRYSREDSYM